MGGGDAEMWRLKGCPKCNGDLFFGQGLDGWYGQCLQCGYIHDIDNALDIKKPIEIAKEPVEVEEEREPVLAGAGDGNRA